MSRLSFAGKPQVSGHLWSDTANSEQHERMSQVTWKDEPEDRDFPAASSYLLLLSAPAVVDDLVQRLRDVPTGHWKAKDILRAAGLPLLPVDNPHVASDLRKIHDGKQLSPVLLVRGDLVAGRVLQVADGYDRVCASYHTDENTDIPCRLVSTTGDVATGRRAP